MAVQQAIEEVNHIIETLRATLDDMEAVLETLELAERQKTADEQEIETLRRGLRRLHRPGEGGQHRRRTKPRRLIWPVRPPLRKPSSQRPSDSARRRAG